jgi:imidazole glycerol phosphate synthase glutamine amidotransferase subunit
VIALVDYGAGNLTSVRSGLEAAGATVRIARRPDDLAGASGIVVPGVGHFAKTQSMDEPWRRALVAAADAGRPLLGICLGMQWLFEGSAEEPDLPGLGLFPGTCRRIEAPDLKVPHVGWNAASVRRGSRIMAGVDDEAFVYFSHTFAAPVIAETVAVTDYGGPFTAAVERGSVSGVQFHPERSGRAGRAMLGNFVRGVEADRGSGTIRDRASQPDRVCRRVIACLDVRDGQVVKGVKFEALRSAGDPAELAARYDEEGIDEIVILDISATIEGRATRAATVAAVARRIAVPLTVGGGIRSEADACAVLDAGADKVSLNTAALEHPEVLTHLAGRYGSQAVIVAIDAKRGSLGYEVYSRSGQQQARREAIEWAREAAERGAGEVLLTSIDQDGTREGFDCPMTSAVSRAVSIPVIASGGAGGPADFVRVFADGLADAALAASIFHDGDWNVGRLKHYLRDHGVRVRL